jgi:hypothetical protein
MKTLTIKDLTKTDALDRNAMTALRGGKPSLSDLYLAYVAGGFAAFDAAMNGKTLWGKPV